MGRRRSIEYRILVSTGILFVVIGSILFLAIRNNAHHAADEAFDRVLGAAALSIADTAEIGAGAVTVDIPYSAFAILGTSRLNRVFYRVVAPDGSIVTGSPVLGLSVPPATSPDMRLSDSSFRGSPVRIAAVARYRTDMVTGQGGWIDVLVAETREAREQLADRLTVNAGFPAVAIAIVAFALIWIGVRQAFSPLRSVENNLRQREPSDLSPISGIVPLEVDALVVALNDFMDRLRSTLDGLQRVTTDAAHQLRTPLTALRALAEIALEETPKSDVRRRLERIHANAVSASVLANQLLADATTLHFLKSQKQERHDLRASVSEAVRRLETQGGSTASLAQLAIDAPPHALWVLAEPVSLCEMIRNLLENAFTHAPGPAVLTLGAQGGMAVLVLDDDGPGIAANMREGVFERFVRGAAVQPGSGLGLAIARDVAQANGGEITLGESSSGGLRVTVRLPLDVGSGIPAARPARGRATILLFGLTLGCAAAIYPGQGWAQPAATPFDITGVIPEPRMAPVIAAISQRFPALPVIYNQARSGEIVAAIMAQGPENPPPDLVLLPSPDIAVQLANEGFATPYDAILAESGSAPQDHWRAELFVLAYDPAVFVIRRAAFSPADIPRSRVAMAQLLEQSRTSMLRRVGIVNVGIDSVSYSLAAQDSLRSPLFWRMARAFGSTQARIYDTSQELLEALDAGEIDLGYNVPLSEVLSRSWSSDGIDYVMPQDYVVSLPWTTFAPLNARHVQWSGEVIEFLLSPDGRDILAAAGVARETADLARGNYQEIDLGPELLVFLDSIKRTRFLDTWFQLVTTD